MSPKQKKSIDNNKQQLNVNKQRQTTSLDPSQDFNHLFELAAMVKSKPAADRNVKQNTNTASN